MHSFHHSSGNVLDLGRNVRKWQVGQQANLTQSLLFEKGSADVCSLPGPGVVVVRKHNGFGHSCGTAGIHQGTTVAWLELSHLFFDGTLLHSLTQCHKVLPEQDPPFASVVVYGRLIVNDDILNRSLLQQWDVFLGLGVVLSHHHRTLRVFSNIRAAGSIVCGVDSHRQTSGEQTAEERDHPCRIIEADDVDCRHVASQLDQGPPEGHAFLEILPIADRNLQLIC